MLKVWRGKRGLFAECTACGSYGTAGHLQPKPKLTPAVEEALEKHTAHMMALRAHYTTAANAIVKQVKNGSMRRPDGVAKIRTLWENHVAQVRLGQAQLPPLEGDLTELISGCPWCNHKEQIEVIRLPEGQAEPDYELAKPVREFIAKQIEAAKKKQPAKQGA